MSMELSALSGFLLVGFPFMEPSMVHIEQSAGGRDNPGFLSDAL